MVKITDSVEWIPACYDLGEKHMHGSPYLITEGDDHLLLDTGSYYHKSDVKSEIDHITNDEGIDALVLTKAHLPHSANANAFLAEWGDPELYVSTGGPWIHGLPESTLCKIGESMRISGRKLSFIDPPLLDVQHTMWIFDHSSGILFTVDGLGHYHSPGDCEFATDGMNGIKEDYVKEFHQRMIPWLIYAEPEKIVAAVEGILDQYDITYLAPSHGNPVHKDDIPLYIDKFERAMERISSEYTRPAEQ